MSEIFRDEEEKESSLLWFLVKQSLSSSKKTDKKKKLITNEDRVLFEKFLSSYYELDVENTNKKNKEDVGYSLPPRLEENSLLVPLGNDVTKIKRAVGKNRKAIDLHGLNQNEAYESLQTFIPMMQREGVREVLIITGKGLKNNSGIFKRVVPLWLEVNPLRVYIASYSYACYRFGGEGALVVRLKKLI